MEKLNHKHLVKTTLSNDAFLRVNRNVMKHLKDANTTLVLSSLIDKHNYFEREGMLENDSFFNTKVMLEDDLGLTEKKILTAERKLESAGLLKTQVKGIGKTRRKYYTLQWEAISRIIQSGGYTTYEMAVTLPTNGMTNDTRGNDTQGNETRGKETRWEMEGDVGDVRVPPASPSSPPIPIDTLDVEYWWKKGEYRGWEGIMKDVLEEAKNKGVACSTLLEQYPYHTKLIKEVYFS